jgi:4-amino-4-deoxy-L-arabinose transferase-like glycosyltransferase
MTGSERRLFVAVVAAAFLFRVAVALAWSAPLAGDAADYHRLAAGLVEGRGYVDTRGSPTAFRPPIYPLLLAGVYRVAGDGPLPIGLVQAVVGTATVAAVGTLAAALLGSEAGLIVAALTAVDAAQLSLTARRLSEALFTLLLVLLLLAAVRARDRLRAGEPAWGWAAAVGLFGALGTLTRGLFVGFPLLVAAALAYEGARGGRRAPAGAPAAGAGGRSLLAALVVVGVYGVGLLPWTLRNARAMGEPVPVATQGGITLYSSWFPPDGTVMGVFPDDSVTRAAMGMSEPEQSRHFVSATARGLAAEPGRIPRLVVLKALYLAAPLDWEVLPIYGGVNPTYLLCAAWAGAFLLVLGGGRRAEAWPLWLPLAYVLLAAIVFYGSPRLRAPVDPLLAALAAGGIVELARRRGAGRARAAVLATGVGALAVAALAAPLKAVALGALRGVGLWRR